MAQQKIKAVYMRGGTSKGLFFLADWLPRDKPTRDKLLLRMMGSPDPFGNQIDGLGAATSSTSKVVIISRSQREDSDLDYLFGQIPINGSAVDWSGNCGNLTGAVGPFAISQGLIKAPEKGQVMVRIWQANINAKIIAHVPVKNGQIDEEGSYTLDGVAFPGTEIVLEYLHPCGLPEQGARIFPTNNPSDWLDIPEVGKVEVTMINAANPAVFIDAATLGIAGTVLPPDVNSKADILRKVELIRSHAAVKMGLAATPEDATQNRQHTPKLAALAASQAFVASGGKQISENDIDFNARMFSMGKLHHAMTGTGAVALAVAAEIPGTLVNRLTRHTPGQQVRIGHPSGRVEVGARVRRDGSGEWEVLTAVMSRTARRLMEGEVFVPENTLK